MRRLLPICVAISCIITAQAFGQNLPPRFGPLAKSDRFHLVRVLGTPETPATFQQLAEFSADGSRAVYVEDLSGGGEKPRLRSRMLIWDLPAKSWPREIEIDGKMITAMCLSKGGDKALLTGQIVTGFAKVKKIEKGKEQELVPEFGSFLALWDLKAGKEIRSLPLKDAGPFACVALSPNEETALTGAKDGMHHWDLKDGKLLGSYREKGVATQTMVVTFLADGKRFLAGNWVSDTKRTGVVRLWEVGKKEAVQTYPAKGELGFVLSIAVARNGKRFVVGDTRPSLTVWETDTGKEIGALNDEKNALGDAVTATALADEGKTIFGVFSKFNPDPDEFAAARLVAWDVEAKKIRWSQPVPYRGQPPIRVADGKLMIGGGPNLFDIWNIADGKQLSSWGGHKTAISAILAFPDGYVVSAGQDGRLLSWLKGHVVDKRSVRANAMVLSPDSRQWLTAGADKTVRVWGGNADKPVHELKGHTGPISALAFSKAGWAVSTSGDRSVKTWDLKAGKVIDTLTGHAEGVTCVAISPDELWLATGSDDATIRVWPIKDGKFDSDRETLVLEGHKKAVGCLAFTPDGKSLISGGQDNNLRVWDWAKEKNIRTIPGHKNWVTSLLFVDEKTILSSSDDLTICLWDWESGKEVGRIDFGLVGDCPRCMTRLGADRLLVGTSDWLIYEFKMASRNP